MPSPFPGMDPFLEEPARWAGVHSRLINAISEVVAEFVSPTFFVEIEERVYIISPDEYSSQAIVPDVYLVRGRSSKPFQEAPGTITAPTLVEPMTELQVRDRYIEIRDTRAREVVTTLEVLSPFNKAAGTQGRTAFLRKRRSVMSSAAHWIEIDLLRAGDRPPEVAANSDYYALLKRGVLGTPFEVWHIDLRDRLPTIAVPLHPPFADVPLNLQQVFDTVYVRAHYADSVDYTGQVPLPPLRPADTIWLNSRLQARSEADPASDRE